MKTAWPKQPIGAVCQVVNGGTPKTGVAVYWNGEHQWVTPAEMGKRNSPYVSETERTLTDKGLANSSATPMPPYSVILSSRAPIGHLVINTVPMATNQGCKGLVPGKAIHYKFLFYYLGSIVDLLNDLGTGATFRELSGGKLKEVTIPVPPLPEQQRIVGILDEAFAGIATAKANAEKNLQNARALFDSHLQSVFTQRKEGWVEKRLGDVAELIDCLHKTPSYAEAGFPMVRVTDIKPGILDLSNARRVDEKTFLEFSRKHTPKPGDIVFSRVGTYGVSSLVNSNERFCLGQNTVFIVPKISSNLLYHFLTSPNAKEQIDEFVDGTTQPTISLRSIREIKIPIPPLCDQQELIVGIESITAESKRLTGIYWQKLAALEALKKSLLHQAITGRL